MSAETPTAPSGPYFKKKDSDARSAASFLASGLDGDSATKVGFVKQGCMSKMGELTLFIFMMSTSGHVQFTEI